MKSRCLPPRPGILRVDQEGLHVHGQGGRDRFIHLPGGRVSLLVHWLFHDRVPLRYVSGAPAAALGDAQQVAVLGDGPPCDDVTESEEHRGELLVGERGAAVLLPDDVPEDREDLLAAALAPVRPGGRLVEEGGGLQGGVGGIEGEPARTCDVGHVAGGPGDLAHVYAGGGLDVLEGHGPRAAEVTRAEEVDLVGGACLQDTAEVCDPKNPGSSSRIQWPFQHILFLCRRHACTARCVYDS